MSDSCFVKEAGELRWRTSSRSANNSYCVEVAVTSSAVGVRDTKDRDGGMLAFDRQQWDMFTASIQRGGYCA